MLDHIRINPQDYFNVEIIGDGSSESIERLKLLEYCYRLRPKEGLCLEFGVGKGYSLNFLSRLDRSQKWWGFDSFNGLPEDWVKGPGDVSKKGKWACEAPEFGENVEIVSGLFEDTLPGFLDGFVSFVHVDCDLYSSARIVLDLLTDFVDSGCVIVFDELIDFGAGGYEFWEDGEWRALTEWSVWVNPVLRTHFYQCGVVVV